MTWDWIFFSKVGDIAPVIKSIPVLKIIVGATKTIVNIRSYYLAKKVYTFLYEIKDTPQESRQRFAKDYLEKNKEDVAITILSILERLNNINNVPILCNLMRAQINGHITIAQFNRVVMALERTAYADLQFLHKFDNDYYEEGVAEALESAGLVYPSVIGNGDASSELKSGIKMKLTHTGRLLLMYGLGVSTEDHVSRVTEVKSELSWQAFE